MSYHRVLIHIVTATKKRRPLITKDVEPILFMALRASAIRLGGRVVRVNGDKRHVHVLVWCPPAIDIACFVRQLKSNATRTVRARLEGNDFAFQAGYSVFSVQHDSYDLLARYIEEQKIRHAKGELREEWERGS